MWGAILAPLSSVREPVYFGQLYKQEPYLRAKTRLSIVKRRLGLRYSRLDWASRCLCMVLLSVDRSSASAVAIVLVRPGSGNRAACPGGVHLRVFHNGVRVLTGRFMG